MSSDHNTALLKCFYCYSLAHPQGLDNTPRELEVLLSERLSEEEFRSFHERITRHDKLDEVREYLRSQQQDLINEGLSVLKNLGCPSRQLSTLTSTIYHALCISMVQNHPQMKKELYGKVVEKIFKQSYYLIDDDKNMEQAMNYWFIIRSNSEHDLHHRYNREKINALIEEVIIRLPQNNYIDLLTEALHEHKREEVNPNHHTKNLSNAVRELNKIGQDPLAPFLEVASTISNIASSLSSSSIPEIPKPLNGKGKRIISSTDDDSDTETAQNIIIRWSEDEIAALKEAYQKHQKEDQKWVKIRSDPEFAHRFHETRTHDTLKFKHKSLANQRRKHAEQIEG